MTEQQIKLWEALLLDCYETHPEIIDVGSTAMRETILASHERFVESEKLAAEASERVADAERRAAEADERFVDAERRAAKANAKLAVKEDEINEIRSHIRDY